MWVLHIGRRLQGLDTAHQHDQQLLQDAVWGTWDEWQYLLDEQGNNQAYAGTESC